MNASSHEMPGLSRREALAAFAISLVVSTLYFLDPLLNGFFEWNDNAHYFLATKAVIGERLRAGDIPLWNPLVGVGLPVPSDPTAGLFYPTVLLYMALPPLVAQTIDLLIHPALSLAFTFLYGRRLGLSRPGASLAALGYGLGGVAAVHYCRQAMINTLPWLPAACLLLEGYRRSGDRRRLVLAGLVLGLTVLAGHPQSALYVWLAVALHTLAVACLERRPRLALDGLLPFVIGAGVAALQLVPTLALQPHLTRDRLTEAQRALGTLRPERITNLISPVEGLDAFLGLVVVLLAVVAISQAGRLSTPLRAWIPVAAAAFLLMLGHYTPLGSALAQVPAFNLLRHHTRHVLYLAMAAPLLAGVALDGLADPESPIRQATLAWLRRRWLLLAFAILLGIGFLHLLVGVPQAPFERAPGPVLGPGQLKTRDFYQRNPPARSTGVELLLFAGTGLALATLVKWPRAVLWFFPLLQLGDSFAFSRHRTSVKCSVKSFFHSRAVAILQAQPEGKGARLVAQPFWRRALPPAAAAPLAPNAPSLFGLASVLIYTATEPRNYVEALEMDELSVIRPGLLARHHVLSLIGTRFVVQSLEGLPQVLAARAQLDEEPTRLVATLSAGSRPTLLRNAELTASSILLQGSSPGSFALAERDVSLLSDRAYLLSVRARAAGKASDLSVDLFAGPSYEGKKLSLVVGGRSLRPHYQTFHRVIDSASAPPTAKLRIYQTGREPIEVERAELHLRPLPRLRAPLLPGERAGHPLPAFQKLGEADGLHLFRDRTALPRAWLVREAVPVHSSAEAALQRDLIADLERKAPVEGIGAPARYGGGSAIIERDSGDELTLAVKSSGPGLLIVSDLHLPGWQARVDGQAAPLYRAYGFLRAIPVPAGTSRVTLAYRCPGLLPGLLASALTLLLCAVALALGGPARRRAGSKSAADRSSP